MSDTVFPTGHGEAYPSAGKVPSLFLQKSLSFLAFPVVFHFICHIITSFGYDVMKRLRLLLLWIWTISFPAASHDYMFKHLEVKDGLSNSQVNAIYKDSNGFMWFGTSSGLNRYDGYGIRIYRSRKDDGKSLPDSYIEDIQEDASGNLWIRTKTPIK